MSRQLLRYNPPPQPEPNLRHVIVEIRETPAIRELATAAVAAPELGLAVQMVPDLPGIEWDSGFPPVEIPRFEELPTMAFGLAEDTAGRSTYLVRGTMRMEAASELALAVAFHPATVQVFADPRIEPFPICPGNPPLGTDADVETLLCVPQLQQRQMDGRGVAVAIVDTGFNLSHLSSQGKTPMFHPAGSWTHHPSVIAGAAPVDHGTMCAFDACIAAPNCTLIDLALLRTGISFQTLLSDAILAFRHLLSLVSAPGFFKQFRGLVVNNSWGMYHPSWDFPIGHPFNYSDNIGHPFNVIVSTLERHGADIVFAAGNCGTDCPDWRCLGVTTASIYGANSHPQVLSVAGVGIDRLRVGYSSTGPGHLAAAKPDLCGYTHFAGSGVYDADGGTSAAAPVVAGVLAALRSQHPYVAADPATHPAALRDLLIASCDPKLTAHSNEYGWGVVSGCSLE